MQSDKSWSSHDFPMSFARAVPKGRLMLPGAASDAAAVKVGTAIDTWLGSEPN
jgi:hypothetical protein